MRHRFFFTATARPRICTLSLHDALPISLKIYALKTAPAFDAALYSGLRLAGPAEQYERSEEHTSELQSRFDLVCGLLLEKKEGRRRGERDAAGRGDAPVLVRGGGG